MLPTPTTKPSLHSQTRTVLGKRLRRSPDLGTHHHATVSLNATIPVDLFQDNIVLVYYRIYTKDGGIPSVNAVYSDDPYLGRILAHTVAPPHTAISLKLCLSNVENIPYNTLTGLFRTVSSEAPMDDTNHLSILAEPGPGCTPDDPVALVTTHSHADRSSLDTVNPKKLPPQDAASPCEMRYSKRRNVLCWA